MRYYVQTSDRKNKASWIVDNLGGRVVDVREAQQAFAAGEGVICVKNNGPFEAAGFIYSQSEFDKFACRDVRPTTWVVGIRDVFEKAAKYGKYAD